MSHDKAMLDRMQQVREQLGELLIPALAKGHHAIRDPKVLADREGLRDYLAVEQLVATYVLAFYTAEVAAELRSEGRVQLVNGDNPLQVRVNTFNYKGQQ